MNTDAAILVDNKNNSGKAVIKLEHDAALVYGSGSASFIIADRENAVAKKLRYWEES